MSKDATTPTTSPPEPQSTHLINSLITTAKQLTDLNGQLNAKQHINANLLHNTTPKCSVPRCKRAYTPVDGAHLFPCGHHICIHCSVLSLTPASEHFLQSQSVCPLCSSIYNHTEIVEDIKEDALKERICQAQQYQKTAVQRKRALGEATKLTEMALSEASRGRCIVELYKKVTQCLQEVIELDKQQQLSKATESKNTNNKRKLEEY